MTITGTQTFASLDGSSSDHDGAANGVFTVSDGNLVVSGVVNCNDDGASPDACAMAFAVSGNMTLNSGAALYAENRSGSGTGAAITLTVGGNLALNGTAIISTASKSSSGSNGGAITANVNGNVTLAAGTTIDSGAANARAGNITIASGKVISIDGNVLAGPSRTILSTRLTDLALDGGTGNSVGGAITIGSSTFLEPALTVGSGANIISQGGDGGAGPVKLDACGIEIRGLIAALSRKDSAAQISIRSGKDVLIDGRDLGGAGTRLGRVRADAPSGTAVSKGVDVFGAETINILGPSGSLFVITAHPGLHDSKSYGGLIRITSLGEGVIASGNVIDSGRTASGDTGGTVQISAKNDVSLNTAVIRAVGDSSTNNSNRGGGSISVRSYSGNVIWTAGTGDVRPVGSTSGLAPADQGSIILTACGSVNTTGSTFPSNGTPTSPLPDTHTGSCSPAAPPLPTGVPPLVTCNTPPVANDATASTNEDTTVTITLSGSDADGDSLTFSVVSGPLHGTTGTVISTGPTTATVDYTPAANYNGTDSFVFRANDGNGGTDDATATITIAPVNDPPTFVVGAPVTVFEDSGAQTIPNWVTVISPGPSDEAGQSVTFTVTTSNPALFSVQPAVLSNGTLTFTPAPNMNGGAAISVTAHDNGGTANGGNDNSAPQNSSINVTAVNDEPSFVKGADQNVNEDAGPQTVSGWATLISAGPNESGQTLTFVTSNNKNELFSVQPAVSSGGTLTYTPAQDAFGTATVTVYLKDDGGTANGGDDTSPSQTFTITVNSVNDAPSFTGSGNVTVNEDSGAYSQTWATAISAGPANESAQTVTFSVTNTNNSLFSVQPALSASGLLTFTLAADANGSASVTVTAQDDGGTANGGVDTYTPPAFTITVNAVNDEPSFTPGGAQTSNEDAGLQTVGWATVISTGPANESTQTITFFASNDNNALFSSQPAIASNGTLTYTAAPNAHGSATVTVYAKDDGGTANGGDDTSATYTFTITINSVNDAPTFTGSGDVTVNEDSGAYGASWANAISAGPADESGQTLTFNIVSNSNPGLFSSGPTISAGGVLAFTPAPNAFGQATIIVNLKDDGGTANGGVDTSSNVTFKIIVNAVNDAPSFTGSGDVTVNEDSGLYSQIWATAISAGPNESGQTLTFLVSNDNPSLFSVQPSISSGGLLSFTPAPNANGSALVTVSLKDNGGTANGGVDTFGPVTFTIYVTAVSDPPAVVGESYETIGNTMLEVSAAKTQSPAVFVSGNLLANDSDTDGPNPLTASFAGASPGAVVVVNPDGTFTYVPPPGFTGGNDSFTYNVSDGEASSTGTVTINVKNRVWYVKNNDGGASSGTSFAPFTTLSAAEAVAAAGDTIYVFTGDGTTAGQNSGFAMDSNQRLLGAGVKLDVPVSVNGGPNPTPLLDPAARPQIGNSGGSAVTATNVSGVEIAGLDISASTSGVRIVTSGVGSGSANVHDVGVLSAGVQGFDIDGGGTGILTVTVSDVSVVSTGNGFDARTSAGELRVALNRSTLNSSSGSGAFFDAAGGTTLVITSFFNNSISGNTGGSGVVAMGVDFDAIPGGTLDVVSGGTLTIGSAGNGVGGSGLSLSAATGHLSFTNLSVEANGPAGVLISGTGPLTASTGTQLSAAAGSLTVTSGAAINASSATLALTLASLTSANSGTSGITLSGISGSLSAAGGSITNATNDDVNISGSSANVSYGGTITDDVGQLVDISTSSGNIAFTGAISDGNDGDGNGVSLAGNSGATITFSGGLLLSTGANPAFSATGGGTVQVCDENPCNGGATGSLVNSLTTTTATALTVTNTNIGANHLEFRSISANGAAKGIILNTTGAAGGLKVSGTGTTDATGGTIQNISTRGGEFISTSALSLKNMKFLNANTTDGGLCNDLSTANCNAAIYLSSVSGAALNNVDISGTTSQQGINGRNVSNFSLVNSTLANCGTPGSVEEGCLKMRELTGTASITGSDLSFPAQDVVEIVNTAGSLTLNVDNSTFRDSQSSGAGGNGLQARSEGSGSMVVNVTNSSFLRIRSAGVHATAINTASNDVDVTTSTFDPGAGVGIGLDLDADHTATLAFNVQNNVKIYSRNGPAVNVFGDTSAVINGRISNNGDVQVKTNVGSNIGSGIRVNINKDAVAKIEVKNNVVNVGSDDAGIDLSAIGKTTANPGGAVNSLDATVTNNTVTIGASSTYGIIILSATSAGNTNALCTNVSTNAVNRNPSSIASFRARVPSVAGFLRMEGFATNPENTWNTRGNTPASASGSEVSFGGSGTFGSCTAALPTNPGPN